MDKMQIIEDTPTKLVLEKSFAGSDMWREWSKSLILPLLFFAGSALALLTGFLQDWWVWVIFGGALIVEAFMLYIFLTSERRLTITIDLPSRTVTRIEALVSGKVKKDTLRVDQVSQVLMHSEEVGHHTKLLLESPTQPPLKIADNYDLLTLDQGKYVSNPSTEDASTIKSLDTLGKKIGSLLEKPVTAKLTDQGTVISQEVVQL